MRFPFAKFPECFSFADTPPAIENDELAFAFLVLVFQEFEFGFSSDKHNDTSDTSNRDLLKHDLIILYLLHTEKTREFCEDNELTFAEAVPCVWYPVEVDPICSVRLQCSELYLYPPYITICL